MSESLEQRALRIGRELLCMVDDELIVEFARRLMAEQGEPVAWATESGLIASEKVMQFHRRHNPGTAASFCIPLYASPPSDALDAKRYRWLRDKAYVEQVEYDSWYWAIEGLPANEGESRSDQFDAAIDAAMEKSHE